MIASTPELVEVDESVEEALPYDWATHNFTVNMGGILNIKSVAFGWNRFANQLNNESFDHYDATSGILLDTKCAGHDFYGATAALCRDLFHVSDLWHLCIFLSLKTQCLQACDFEKEFSAYRLIEAFTRKVDGIEFIIWQVFDFGLITQNRH